MNTPTVNQRGQIILSPAELHAATAHLDNHPGGEWYGGETGKTARARLLAGCQKAAGRAQSLVDSMPAPEICRPEMEWQDRPAGAFPNVPAYLAGMPDCMRAKVQAYTEKAPIRIWVDIVSGADIDAKSLERRGAAAAALAFRLIQSGRTIELMTFTSCHGKQGKQTVICTQLPTAPANLGQIAFCLSSQGFARLICYELAERINGFNGHWSEHANPCGNAAARTKAAREYTLKGLAAPADIILPAPVYPNEEALANPGKWTADRIAECNAAADEEHGAA